MEPLSNIPGGMRYYFGREARLRRAVEDAAMSVFDGWGYEEIATPSVDYYLLFERGMGREEARRSFRFTDTDGRLLALRPDVTSSVARAAATLFAGAARPLRFCYAASVFRQRPRSHAEWRRQERQIGCELIGAGRADADLEVLAMTAEVLERLGTGGSYRVTLNHVGVFNGIAEQLGLGADAREAMRQLIDARDAAALEQFLKGLGKSAQTVRRAGRLASLAGARAIPFEARELLTNERSRAALDELERLRAVVESLGIGDGFSIDLSDVSGLDYYTGLVFKIYVAGAGARVGGGGRYDELTANFGRREPAVGFVLDLDALTDILARTDFGSQNGVRTSANIIEGADAAERFREARRRRAQGERIRME
ncbi:MAG: phosphoribosyltransferase regulatory subunit [Acidobacteriota bacterium]|jgi:ATP phosphoribosyltransferase regulatory subunit|nr:phosphoribosyltransferase regulatory subunit [Acidobacteriota bacterium]